MTWSARISKSDGSFPKTINSEYEDYNACTSCKHGQYGWPTGGDVEQVVPCNIPNVSSCLGSILTSVDVGADGHMASGEAILKCNGYEEK